MSRIYRAMTFVAFQAFCLGITMGFLFAGWRIPLGIFLVQLLLAGYVTYSNVSRLRSIEAGDQ